MQDKDNTVHERVSFAAGKKIFEQGDRGNCAFLIQSGSVKIYMEDEDKRRVDLAEIGPGEIFGEMALVFDGPRSATAEAMKETNLIVITRQLLNDKLKRSDPTIRALVPMLMKRISQGNVSMLRQQSSLTELGDLAETIYQNIQAGLGPQQKQGLSNIVLPPLKEFLSAIKSFRERYDID